jgi:hypothetical protein
MNYSFDAIFKLLKLFGDALVDAAGFVDDEEQSGARLLTYCLIFTVSSACAVVVLHGLSCTVSSHKPIAG